MKKLYIINYEKKKMKPYMKKIFSKIKAGYVLIVLYRYKYYNILTPFLRQFIGICLGKKFSYYTSTLIIRNFLNKEGIEFQFNAFSKNVLSIKRVKMSKGKYKRNKIYYLRQRIAWESTILFDKDY